MENKVEVLAADAFAFLKEAEYWYDRYDEVAALLRDAGYYQIGGIIHNPYPWVKEEGFQHPVFVECDYGSHGLVGRSSVTATELLEWISDGPKARSDYFRHEPSEDKKQNKEEVSAARWKHSERGKLLATIGAASAWICVYCQQGGTTELGPDGRRWHIDHLFAEANGGDSRQDNLILSCATCNIKKNRKLASAILASIKTRMESDRGK